MLPPTYLACHCEAPLSPKQMIRFLSNNYAKRKQKSGHWGTWANGNVEYDKSGAS